MVTLTPEVEAEFGPAPSKHSDFWRGVHDGRLHGTTITTKPIKLPPLATDAAFYHGFRAGLRLAWRWIGHKVPQHDRYVAAAWRRYEKEHGR